jgi:hypothetical protein
LLTFSPEPFVLSSKNIKVRIYKTIILPVVLYGCETWSLKVRDEVTLQTFENRELWRISGSKKMTLCADGGKLHNEELHNI